VGQDSFGYFSIIRDQIDENNITPKNDNHITFRARFVGVHCSCIP